MNNTLTSFLVFCTLLSVVGCAQKPKVAAKDMVARICDDQGCRERNVNDGAPEVKAGLSHEQIEQRDALEELAERKPAAAYDLALRYLRGDGVVQDDYQFVQWLRKSGKAGHLEAQKALGRLYLAGLSEMGPDGHEAKKWLNIAASRGDAESKELLKVATRMSAQQRNNHRWHRHYQNYYAPYWYNRYAYHYRWYRGYWAPNPAYKEIEVAVPVINDASGDFQ